MRQQDVSLDVAMHSLSVGSQLTLGVCCVYRTDRVTSVMIPLAFTAVGLFVGGKGLYHMYTGTGKLE